MKIHKNCNLFVILTTKWVKANDNKTILQEENKVKTYWRVLSSVTLAAFLMTACGTAETEKEVVGGSPDTGVELPSDNNNKVPMLEEDAIAVELLPKENGDLMYEFKLNNITDKDIDLTFASLQEFDFILKAQDGTKVFQYSDDRAFGEAFVERTIPVNGSIVIEIDLLEYIPDLESGMYSLEVWSSARESDGLRTEIELMISKDSKAGVLTEVVNFNGIVDSNFVEVTNEAGIIKVYQISDDVKTYINDIPENEQVTINYYEGENNQLVISSIIID